MLNFVVKLSLDKVDKNTWLQKTFSSAFKKHLYSKKPREVSSAGLELWILHLVGSKDEWKFVDVLSLD